jgi:hypothetical protein
LPVAHRPDYTLRSSVISQWPTGEYELKAVATFDETVNDGLGDYPAGDYIFVYNVVVKKSKEGAFAPSMLVNKSVFE